jgi:hypothetical protein
VSHLDSFPQIQNTTETLNNEIAAWEKHRNEQLRTIDWQFTTDDARIKLKRLYPSVLP